MSNTTKANISKDTWYQMREEEREEEEASFLILEHNSCNRCKLGLECESCSKYRQAAPIYYNPIIYAINGLIDKLSGVKELVREIGGYSSGTEERELAVVIIQQWWLRTLHQYNNEPLNSYWDPSSLAILLRRLDGG
ncbi:MAG: hypothetical protein GY861_06155 [bacterium]|nr:hypothetical protein [bacterium]